MIVLLGFFFFLFWVFKQSYLLLFLFGNSGHGRRYGVIQCDPLILQGLDRTVSRPVIFYFKLLKFRVIFVL